MIPQMDSPMAESQDIVELPALTFRIDWDKDRLDGKADGLEAVRQAIYLILSTERYQYLIYGRDYGVELAGLMGEPQDFVQSELKRRITEALERDDRIISVEDFSFELARGKVTARFMVCTIYGNVEQTAEVAV